MKRASLLTLLLSLCLFFLHAFFFTRAYAHQPKAFPCLSVVPGQSIGSVRIGMTLQELHQLKKHGVSVHLEQPSLSHIYLVSKLRVILTQTANPTVRFIDATIHPADQNCVQIDDKIIHPARNWLHTAATYGRCEPIERRTGGNAISCANKGMMLLKSRSPGFRITVSPTTRSIQHPRCDGYVQRGVGIAAHEQWTPAFPNFPTEWALQQGKTYCMDHLLLSTQTTPSQIPTMGECTTLRRRGGSIVYCNHSGLALFFAGPHAKLERIVLYHQSHLPLSIHYPPQIKK